MHHPADASGLDKPLVLTQNHPAYRLASLAPSLPRRSLPPSSLPPSLSPSYPSLPPSLDPALPPALPPALAPSLPRLLLPLPLPSRLASRCVFNQVAAQSCRLSSLFCCCCSPAWSPCIAASVPRVHAHALSLSALCSLHVAVDATPFSPPPFRQLYCKAAAQPRKS